MTKLKLNLMIMLMLYLFAGSMRAEKNLTVYEGTDTQGMIPVAGGTFNYYNKSQYVIPAAQLTDMVGSNIYALAYHLTTDNDNEMMEGSVNVYIKEVGYTTIRSYASDLSFAYQRRYKTHRNRVDRTYTIIREA